MKQKTITASSKPVSEDRLKQILDDYPTKAYLKKNYPTKDDLKKALLNHPTHLDLKIAIQESEARQDERARRYRDEILSKLDQIVGELAQIREDRLFETHDQRMMESQIIDHEERIKKLEKKVN